MLIWSLFDDYLIDYLIDYFIDYLASNNQQIIQIIHVLFWWIFWLFDEYLIDYLIEYLICLICEYLIWLIWDYLMIIWLFRLNCFAYVMLIWWLLVPNYLWLFDHQFLMIICSQLFLIFLMIIRFPRQQQVGRQASFANAFARHRGISWWWQPSRSGACAAAVGPAHCAAAA